MMRADAIVSNVLDQFMGAAAEAGVESSSPFVADGKLHRVRVAGDERSERSGWYVLYLDGLPAGAFGNWRSGEEGKWCAKGSNLTAEERAAFKRRMEEARAQREADERARHEEASKRAVSEWESAAQATCEHPYLTAKGIESHGARVDTEGRLLVPLRDSEGNISTLERIGPDGEKKFLFGGRKQGSFFFFGTAREVENAGRIVFAEGFATGASLREVLGLPTVAAMDKGNLRPVAEALRKKYPTTTLIFCADNDSHGRGQEAARDAAQAVGGRVVVCPLPGCDFNDLASERGAEAVRVAITPHLEPEAAFLFDRPPVLLNSFELPILRADLFQVWLGDMINATAEATETPSELAALLGLGTVAACVQGKVIVNPSPDHREPLSLFVAPALDSGNRKTAVLLEMTRPLRDWEHERAQALQPEVDKATSQRKTLEARVEHLRKLAAKEEGLELENLKVQIAEVEQTMPEVPSIPRLWTQDVTPERLGSLMAENDERIAIISDEAGIFEILEGRYSNGIPNLDLILQGHAGAPVRVDRGTRKPVHLQNPALTVALSPQPEIIQGLALKPGFRGKGLLARFLFALPPSPLGYRKLTPKPIPQAVRAAYERGLRALLDAPPAVGEDGQAVPVVLGFSEDAFLEWQEFSLEIEHQMREDGKFAQIRDWGGKLPGAAVRIAGLLHCVKHAGDSPFPSEVSLATVQLALEIAAVLSMHAIAAFDMMGADPAIEGAKKAWRWIERTRAKTFSARDCFQALKGSFKRMATFQPALDVLVERAYLAELPPKKKSGAGRNPSPAYTVNPALTERLE